MAHMFGKNRDKYAKVLAIVLGIVIILAMVFSYFSLLV